MPSNSKRPTNEQTRTYDRASSVVFLKTDAPFGGLSNMAGGFPLHVQGTRIYTSEALYQACRFPHLPEVQRLIVGQASPMTAKMKSKPHRKDSRPDWDRVRVKVMRWCLRVKLVQNWAKFSELLLRIGDRPIVEESRRDEFWGAKPMDEQTLVGMNVLGRLLMELREAVKAQGPAGFHAVEPLDIPEFLFLGRPIGTVSTLEPGPRDAGSRSTARAPDRGLFDKPAEPSSLVDTPTAREGPAPAYIASPTPESTRLGELEPYPAMKDSGVPWLGEVPEHWQTERAKWLFRKMNRPVQDSDEVVTCFRDGTVTLRRNRRVRGFTESLKEIGYQGIRRGDLVIHAMDAFAGAIGVADTDGKGTPVYSVCEPGPTADSHFYAYAVREMARTQWIQALAKGIRERSTDFRFEAFGSEPVPLPPLPEQAAIVRFLDHADRRIRRYIRAKQKLIKLLEEQKQAIIHRAVTRGLDPNVHLKPSGVEWLGDVPEHWEVRPVRRMISLVTSGSRGWADYYSDDGDIFIQSGNLGRSLSLNFAYTQYVKPPPGAEGVRTSVQRNDVLVCITGALTGNVIIVDVDLPKRAFVNQHVALLRPKQEVVLPRYLAFALRSEVGQSQFKTSEYGGTKQGLGLDDVKSTVTALPPLPEQVAICVQLDESLAAATSAMSATQREIDLWREYRTRLIADAVTGKLDVQEAAARLPREAEDVEPLDEAEVQDDAEETDAGDGVPEGTET